MLAYIGLYCTTVFVGLGPKSILAFTITVDFTKLLPKYSKFRSKVRKFVAKFKVHIENHKPVS